MFIFPWLISASADNHSPYVGPKHETPKNKTLISLEMKKLCSLFHPFKCFKESLKAENIKEPFISILKIILMIHSLVFNCYCHKETKRKFILISPLLHTVLQKDIIYSRRNKNIPHILNNRVIF